jgi:hypothetical protein
MSLVVKKGRMPYNPKVPRVPEDLTKLRVNPDHISIQKWINTGPGGTIDETKLALYLEKKQKKKKYSIIDPNEIYDVVIGTNISYITKDNKWRSGGFLVSIKDSNTEFMSDKIGPYKTYIHYKAYNNALYSLQMEDIYKIVVFGPMDKDEHNKTVEFKGITNITKYPAYIGDVVVYYARDSYRLNRFLGTTKYNRAKENGFKFKNSDTIYPPGPGNDDEEFTQGASKEPSTSGVFLLDPIKYSTDDILFGSYSDDNYDDDDAIDYVITR